MEANAAQPSPQREKMLAQVKTLRGREPAKLGALYVGCGHQSRARNLAGGESERSAKFLGPDASRTLYQITGQLQEAASHLEAAGDYFSRSVARRRFGRRVVSEGREGTASASRDCACAT